MAAADYTSLVQSIYISYFGRPADTFGLASFADQLNTLKAPITVNGLTAAYKTSPAIKSLIDSFGFSAESTALYGTDTVAFVTAIYNNVLNRAPDFDGLVFWVKEINAGNLTKANASLAIMAGAVNNTSAQGVIDAQVLANKVTIATNFTIAIDTGAEVSAYVGNAAAATARDMLKTVTATTVPATFQATVEATLVAIVTASIPVVTVALTSSVADNIVGGPNSEIINGTLGATGTLSGFDSVDGGAGKDTLNLVDVSINGTSSIAGSVVIKNVETINLSSAQAVAIDTTGYAGVTALNIQSTGADIVTVAAATSVNVIDVAGAVAVNGGNNVSVTTTAGNVSVGVAATVGSFSSAAAKAVGNVSVKTDGVGTVTIVGGKNIATSSASSVDISQVTGTVAVTTSAAAADIKVKGGTDVSIVSAANSGTITLGNQTITPATDATTGKQTISNIAEYATGNVTITNLTTTAAGVTTYGTSITNVYTNGASSVSVIGSGGGNINDVGIITLVPSTGVAAVAGTSKLTTVALTGVSGATTIASDVFANLALTKVSAGVTAVVAGAHALTIASAANAATVTDATATAVTINTSGTTTDALALSATKAVSLNIGGSGTKFALNGATLVLGDTATATATNVAVTGSVVANLGDLSAQTKLAGVDASANTGGVTATIGAATSFTGGSGAEVLTVGATSKAIFMGDGNDTVIVTTSALSNGGSINGGAGADTLSMTGALAAAASLSNTFAGTVTGFETLSVTLAGASGAEVINLDVLGNYNSVTTGAAANSLSLQGMVTGGTLKLTSDVGAGSYIVGINGALASTSDVLNISLSKSGILVGGSVTAANVESVNIVTADLSTAGGSLDSLTLNATSAKSIVVSGNAGLFLTATDTAATSVDASGITLGGFTFTSGALAAAASIKGSVAGTNTVDFSLATKAVTYTGGKGADVVTANNAANLISLGDGTNLVVAGNGNNQIAGGTGDDTVTVGSGNNTVSLGNGTNSFTAGNGNNIYVGGTGVDNVKVGNGVNTISTGTGADVIIFTTASVNGQSYSTVMDAHSGVSINFGAGAGAAAINPVALTLAATAVFQDYLDAATAGNTASLSVGSTSYFVFGGNTYVVTDHSSALTYQNGVDSVVKLIGVIDLSATGATFASGIVTLK